MVKIIIVLICATATWACRPTANYCATSLCSPGRTHIGCGHTGAFAPTCDTSRELIDITPYIDLIVTMHNHYRNLIAGGDVPGFSTAERMGTMEWCDELSKLAVINVKQCQMKHDQCRNTDNFKWSGQNLGWRWGSPAGTPEASIATSIESWFNEYVDATMADINAYPSSGPAIGHFTTMVNDRNIACGCGLLRQAKSGGTEYFFACNYAQTNRLGRTTYVSGPVASRCTTGTNMPTYPNLCSPSEPIDPNQIV